MFPNNASEKLMNENEYLPNMLPMGNIGARIKRVRETRRMTQAQLAAVLGVERQAVTNWERGRRPTLENLYQISKNTNVAMEWFMAGRDDLPIPFLDVAEEVMTAASDPAVTLDEAAELVTLTFLALKGALPEAEARIAARAVIRAFRKPPAPPRLSLSDEEKRSAVIEAIRLFLPE
jgi:transcriptional regulator with XRE-family HTH domain